MFEQVIIQLFNGLSTGSIFALTAAGLSLVFGVMKVVNFAHGEMYMLGAFSTWIGIQLTGNMWFGLLLGFVAVGIIGLILQMLTIRPVLGRHLLYSLLCTFGLSLILAQGIQAIFGADPKPAAMPIDARFPFFGFAYPWYRIVIMGVAALTLGGLWLFLTRTKYGRWITATAQDSEMAAALGIPVPTTYTLVFALGAGLGAIAGAMVTPLYSASPHMGSGVIIQSFQIVIIGGLGSLRGSILAAFMIAEIQAVGSVFIDPTQAQILSFIFLMVVLLIRPTGLLEPFGGRA